jgi:O-antigen/teichoic acid export membrane protein
MTVERRETLVLLAGAGGTAVFSLLWIAYAGRVLGPEEAADFLAAAALLTTLATAAAPVNGTVTRFAGLLAARDDLAGVRRLGETMVRAVARYGIVALVAGALLLVPLRQLLDFRSVGPPAAALLIAFLIVLAGVPRGMLRGVRRFTALSANTVAESVARLIAGVGLLAFRATPLMALGAWVAGLGVALAVAPAQLRFLPAAAEGAEVDRDTLARFTAPMFVLAATAAALAGIDVLLVKALLPRTDAGLYAAAAALSRAVAVLLTPFRIHALPLMVASDANSGSAIAALGRLLGRFALLSALPLALLLFLPEPLMRLVYGEAFAGAAVVLPWLTLLVIINSVTVLVTQAFVARGRFRFLGIYVACLVAQVTAIALRHGSGLEVAKLALGCQAVCLVMLVTMLWRQQPTKVAA